MADRPFIPGGLYLPDDCQRLDEFEWTPTPPRARTLRPASAQRQAQGRPAHGSRMSKPRQRRQRPAPRTQSGRPLTTVGNA